MGSPFPNCDGARRSAFPICVPYSVYHFGQKRFRIGTTALEPKMTARMRACRTKIPLLFLLRLKKDVSDRKTTTTTGDLPLALAVCALAIPCIHFLVEKTDAHHALDRIFSPRKRLCHWNSRGVVFLRYSWNSGLRVLKA